LNKDDNINHTDNGKFDLVIIGTGAAASTVAYKYVTVILATAVLPSTAIISVWSSNFSSGPVRLCSQKAASSSKPDRGFYQGDTR
jgi:hypothetical protein